MAQSAVVLDCDNFARAFLPQSVATYNSASSSRHVFSSLEHADALSNREISELIIQALDGNRLAEGSTMSYFRPYKVAVLNSSTSNAAIFRAEHTKTTVQPSWVEQRIPLSFFRHCVGSDPFDTTSHDDEYGEIKMARSKVFNHLNAAAELLFAAQQRVFLFFLVVIGRRFRLLRWDRAGIVTTPSIDYYEQPDLLCDYVWRLSHLDDTALGFDPSATRVLPGDVNSLTMDFAALENPNDADHAERVLRDNESTDPTTFEYARTLFRTSLASDWPRYKVQVSCGTTDRNFLIGRPTFRASGVFGRGTRGYVALDCKTGRFVWLKDAWRTVHILTDTEGDVLQKLNGAGVENIPTLLCHGDVYDQRTVTGEWWERAQSLSSLPSPSCAPSSTPSSRMGSTSPSSKKRKRVNDNAEDPTLCSQADVPLRQHRHYRIVVAEVALPLDHFRNGKQLASIVLDAMQGKLSLSHYQAATNPMTLILHRDISGGNILIHPRVKRNEDGVHTMVWGGILSDWELSKPVDDEHSPSKATQAEQVGTYQFMSVNLLSHPSKPVKISDELESFFHVLVYYSIRYLQSNCAHPMSYIDNYFNNYAGPGRLHTCGWKSLAIEVDEWLSTRFPHRPLLLRSPMDDILASLLSCFQAHYKVMKDDFAKTGPPIPEPEHPPLDPSGKGLAPIFVRKIVFFDDDDDDGHVSDDSSDDDDDDDTPTPEERDLARQILDHAFVLDLVATIVRSADWPEDDRIPSTTARTSDPHPPAQYSDTSRIPPFSSNKRRRIAGPEHIASLPARLHQSMRRTRVQPRTMPLKSR